MKYKNLTVLFKNDPNCVDDICGTHKVIFNDANLLISGDYVIITESGDDVSITGKIFPVKSIESFKGEVDYEDYNKQ